LGRFAQFTTDFNARGAERALVVTAMTLLVLAPRGRTRAAKRPHARGKATT
jgi:hypothetical protein